MPNAQINHNLLFFVFFGDSDPVIKASEQKESITSAVLFLLYWFISSQLISDTFFRVTHNKRGNVSKVNFGKIKNLTFLISKKTVLFL